MADGDDNDNGRAAQHQNPEDRDFGPDLSQTSMLRRRLMGAAMIVALFGIVLMAVFAD